MHRIDVIEFCTVCFADAAGPDAAKVSSLSDVLTQVVHYLGVNTGPVTDFRENEPLGLKHLASNPVLFL